ncbi:MAG TPA: hypothetical protein VK563_19025 [Puia sp.]|nr:hypothetical protein [Puia sp.]
MGLIREPKNVDFYSIDKPWTEKELAEFRQLMEKLKTKNKTRQLSRKIRARKKTT